MCSLPICNSVFLPEINYILFDAVSDSFIVFVHIVTNLQDWVICNGSHRLLVQIKQRSVKDKARKTDTVSRCTVKHHISI